MDRRSFILFPHSPLVSGTQTGLFDAQASSADRASLARWESLLRRAEDPDLDEGSAARRFLDRQLRRAIVEVDHLLQGAPRDASLHLMMVRLHLAGSDELFNSGRVVHHARRAIDLASSDPEVLSVCGDALAFHGLIHNNILLWREGVAVMRRAYAISRTSAHRHRLRPMVAHRPVA
jgi:hypothetical protein